MESLILFLTGFIAFIVAVLYILLLEMIFLVGVVTYFIIDVTTLPIYLIHKLLSKEEPKRYADVFIERVGAIVDRISRYIEIPYNDEEDSNDDK